MSIEGPNMKPLNLSCSCQGDLGVSLRIRELPGDVDKTMPNSFRARLYEETCYCSIVSPEDCNRQYGWFLVNLNPDSAVWVLKWPRSKEPAIRLKCSIRIATDDPYLRSDQ